LVPRESLLSGLSGENKPGAIDRYPLHRTMQFKMLAAFPGETLSLAFLHLRNNSESETF
jgi:hypothetical protein